MVSLATVQTKQEHVKAFDGGLETVVDSHIIRETLS